MNPWMLKVLNGSIDANKEHLYLTVKLPVCTSLAMVLALCPMSNLCPEAKPVEKH